MPASALQLDQLLARMRHEPASMVITPTTRAASSIRTAYDALQRTAGLKIWAPANVLSWQQFLSTLWTQLLLAGHEDRLLLNSAQEHLLWRDLISADRSTTTLTPVDSLATLASTAWSLAAAYRATTRIRSTASTEDTRTFASWAEEFIRHCGRNRLLAPANLEAALEEHLHENHLAVPKSQLLLCSLDDLNPSQRSLLNSLEKHNAKLEPIELVVPNPVAGTIVLADERAELRFAILHLRDHLGKFPTHTGALLVPSLDAELPGLEPALRELLAPELEDIAQDPSSCPWELTASVPLTNTQLVSALLDLAKWFRGSLPLDRISALLLSPYFSTGTGAAQRARFDAHHIQRELLLRPELDLRSVVTIAREKSPELAPWFRALYDVFLELSAAPSRRSYAEWGQFFRQLARTAGWPGPRILTPAEHEVTLAFEGVLDLLATLDFTGKKITFLEALDAFEKQLTRTPTPAVPSGARLLVLSPSEAEGLTFDTAVFLRATDANLPAQLRPNPLLDWSLQRSLGMPGADPEQAHSLAQERLERLLKNTGSLLLTSAAHSEAGALRPSTLPMALGVPPATDPVSLEVNPPPIFLERLEDAAPLPPPPTNELSGGSRLLKLQAACGFLAFAELRLGGREIESQDAGFDARESGNVLHRALQNFWDEVRTQSALAAMTTDERKSALGRAIDSSFEKTLRVSDSWDNAYIELQKERLLRLLLKWLDFELQRAPFEVMGREESVRVTVGPLHLKLRMDRVDELPDGGFVLIDYKTGLGASPSSWDTDRPDEPQLPLYTLLTPTEELRGIAFGRVRVGDDMQWTGFASDPGILPPQGSRLVDIPTVTAEWRAVLTQLAQDFHDGKTAVDPKDHTVNCPRCAQRLLCRLDIQTLSKGLASEEPLDD